MVLADFIVLGLFLLFCAGGAYIGFGRGLEAVSKGIVGWLLSVVACYFLLGVVTEIGFVQDFMLSIIKPLSSNGAWYAKVLVAIRIDIITVVLILFVLVTAVRILIVTIFKNAMETQSLGIVIINKILGFLLYGIFFCMLALIVFQILAWIGGGTAENVANGLKGSLLGLDKIFAKNPLKSLIAMVNIV